MTEGRGAKHHARLKSLFAPLVPLQVRPRMWLADQVFLEGFGSSTVGRPSFIGLGFAYAAKAISVARSAWEEAAADYTLRLYQGRNSAHYAKGGRGYVNLDNLSDADREQLYGGLQSRLALFARRYPGVLEYADGDSFLDAGCGKGQNLKFIAESYPASDYIGFDVDERCLEVASVGVRGAPGRVLRCGSIVDTAFLESFSTKSLDHVVVSYVFSTLLGRSVAETRAMHSRIVTQLVRIARKSVIILDSTTLEPGLQVHIEQRTRAVIRENIASYFSPFYAEGECLVLLAESSPGVLFKFRGKP